jgi:hypothetical protein
MELIMKGKAALVIGAAVGYVFGTRAGHERYEQIKSRANRLWQDPRVQEKAAAAQDRAKEEATQLQEMVAGATRTATGLAPATAKKTSGGDHHPSRVDERAIHDPGHGVVNG